MKLKKLENVFKYRINSFVKGHILPISLYRGGLYYNRGDFGMNKDDFEELIFVWEEYATVPDHILTVGALSLKKKVTETSRRI